MVYFLVRVELAEDDDGNAADYTELHRVFERQGLLRFLRSEGERLKLPDGTYLYRSVVEDADWVLMKAKDLADVAWSGEARIVVVEIADIAWEDLEQKPRRPGGYDFRP